MSNTEDIKIAPMLSIFTTMGRFTVVRFHHNGKIDLDMKITQQIIINLSSLSALEIATYLASVLDKVSRFCDLERQQIRTYNK
jgi:hypothetical protein